MNTHARTHARTHTLYILKQSEMIRIIIIMFFNYVNNIIQHGYIYIYIFILSIFLVYIL